MSWLRKDTADSIAKAQREDARAQHLLHAAAAEHHAALAAMYAARVERLSKDTP